MKCSKCHFDNPSDSAFCSKCGTQLLPSEEISAPTETLEAAREELTRGTTFAGRYEIIEELGKGGMGKVYRVEDKKIKEEVALKLIKPEIASDKKTIERFSNELKMARKIAHRNVCRMYDLGEEKGTHYITMEYVPGEDLKSTIRRVGPLGAGKTIFIAKQVCEGLSEAHRLGVVHRDLKPQNIMIDKEGNARIMDFGIARSIAGKGITGAGVMIGTPEYMSPEQAEVKEVDQRSDIYSLGVILYEMVTGRVPFEGETPLGIAMKHKSEVPKDPKELNAQIPDDISGVILRCLEKDKDRRYQSVGEVRSELEKIEKGIPTTEREIPKRKPITSREITVQFSLKKLLIPALVVVAIVIAAVVIWQLFPKKEVIPIPSDKPFLAVMYFENNTGDESLDHWRKALSDLVIADLSQSKLIRVLSRDRLFNILSELNQLDAKSYSSKVLNEVAIRGGVNHLLQGAYAKAGDNIRINVMLQDTSTGELIGSEGVEGKGEKSIFSMVDELTKKIKENFRLSADEIASDIDKQVGKITTSSPEAYKHYSEGKNYYDMGNNRKAIQFFERAVAIDPEFAIAYMDMAVAYFNLGYDSEEKKYIQKAFELRDRVSDRERYQIEAEFYAESEKTFDKSIEAFNKLLELYPDDLLGNKDLGWLYCTIEQWDKATERFKVCIQNNDTDITTYTNQAASYRANGLYDKAQEILEYYLINFSDNAVIHVDLSYNYLCQSKYDLALIEVDKAISLAPTYWGGLITKGDIYLYKGDLIKAEKEYQKLLDSEESTVHMRCRFALGVLYMLQGRFEESKIQIKQGIELSKKLGEEESESFFHLKLAYLYLKSGNPEKALKECNKSLSSAIEAESLRFKKFALHSKGLSFIEMKLMDEAQRTADELKDEVQKGLNKKEIRLYYHLLGMLELQKENFAKAIEYFEETISLLPYHYYGSFDMHALFIDSLALGYSKAGNLEKAEEEYKKITALTTGRIHYGDIYAKSFYMLGKIYEQKGWKGKAIEHYEKFLELWKDADPGIPEVEDARKRVAGLKD